MAVAYLFGNEIPWSRVCKDVKAGGGGLAADEGFLILPIWQSTDPPQSTTRVFAILSPRFWRFLGFATTSSRDRAPELLQLTTDNPAVPAVQCQATFE
jgi:hypothetical protein